MQLQKNHQLKSFFTVLMITLLCFGLIGVNSITVFAQAPGIIVVIGSDTIWTKADSPHVLTGPLLVNQGLTLTIEAGSIVNLNGYELRVNGTLRAIGTSSSLIRFENGTINFTDYSNAWNEQEGSGSILQYAVLEDVNVFNSVPVSINENPVGENNVWTKAESPITFTDSVFVDAAEILTIEAGVTVDMQYHDLIVKGTIRVLGSSSDKVNFSCGTIKFTDNAIGWDEQTGSGSIIDYAVLDVNVFCNSSAKISNSNLTSSLLLRGSPTVTENVISTLCIEGGSSKICNNVIDTIVACYGSPEIADNTIGSIVGSGDSPVISGNTITKVGYVKHTGETRKEIHFFDVHSPIITGNIVSDGIYLNATGKPTISYNTISGHSYTYTYYTYGVTYSLYPSGTETAVTQTSGIILEGEGELLGNAISDCLIGIKGGSLIERNLLLNNDFGIEITSDAVVQGNTFDSNNKAIFSNNQALKITDNLFLNNGVGLYASGSLFIERNSLVNNSVGLSLYSKSSQITVKNNTFSKNADSINIKGDVPVSINYNNFENCVEKSIRLMLDSNAAIDATNNWWGTADTQAINLTIHDYKYEFGLGKVNFMPFLTEPNLEAKPNENPKNPISSIPEFTSIVLSLVLMTALLVANRRKLLRRK